MKLIRLSIATLGLISLSILAASAIQFHRKDYGIGEFGTRYNEISQVVQGIDPFLIWNGSLKSDRFYPYNRPEENVDGTRERIHAYTPWSYTYWLPVVATMKRPAARTLYNCLMMASFLLVMALAYRYGKSFHGNSKDGFFCALASTALGVTAGASYIVGNYGMLIAGAIVLMAVFLNRRHDMLAGVCWALAMTKPQDAALLAIPLILAKKWKPILTALTICLLATLPPAYLCGRSPLDLILQVPKLRETGLGTNTSCIVTTLLSVFPSTHSSGYDALARALFLANVLFGTCLCGTLSWMTRNCTDWFRRLAPAVLCAAIWTYMTYLDRCIFFFLQITIIGILLSRETQRAKTFAGLTSLLISLLGFASFSFCYDLLSSIGARFNLLFAESALCNVLNRLDAFFVLTAAVVAFLWCLAASRSEAFRGKNDEA